VHACVPFLCKLVDAMAMEVDVRIYTCKDE
jgi:hypothetical protein